MRIEPDATQRQAASVPPEGQCAPDDATPVLRVLYDHLHRAAVLGTSPEQIGEATILMRQWLRHLRCDDVERLGELVKRGDRTNIADETPAM